MRLASGILSLLFGLIALGQSCLVNIGGSIVGDASTSEGGAVGLLVALLFIIGGAFAFKVPKVAMVFTGIAGFLGLAVGKTTSFSDMSLWGVVAIILTVLIYIGSRKPRRTQRPADHTRDPETLDIE